jgi:hypothetical protein
MGALYTLKLRNRRKGDALGIEADAPIRTSAQISAAALSAHYPQMSAGVEDEDELDVSEFLQNWRWYVREHWKQALVTVVCYLLTILLWQKFS